MNHKEEARLYKKFYGLQAETRSLVLGTIDVKGLPRVSYAPYVRCEAGNFHIYVSRLSAHTAELTQCPVASVLLIEDESSATQIFARMRITYLCNVLVIERSDSVYQEILTQFSENFGDVINVLTSLPDFVLFRLVPQSGRFVTGFGQAYDLTGEHLDKLIHIGPEQIKRP